MHTYSQPSPSQSPAGRLLPDPRGKRVRRPDNNNDDGDVEDEEEDGEPYTSTPMPRPKKQRLYDPFSQDPTPLAIRRHRRK